LRSDVLRGDRFKAAVISALIVIAACIGALLVFYAATSSERLISHLESIGLFSFTGRTAIWAITWEEFVKSPITGYGPSIWDPEFRVERGIYFAGQAHNQFIHVLGQAGLLGLIGILIHLGVMLYFALTRRSIDRGLAIALLLMLLVRCWSESPLRLGALMGWDAFIHLIAFVSVVGLSAHPRPNRAQSARAPNEPLLRSFA
jgi:O-antigen ligase